MDNLLRFIALNLFYKKKLIKIINEIYINFSIYITIFGK